MIEATYQTRRRASDEWEDLGGLWEVRKAMELAGFRYSELVAHVEDLDRWHVLTAEDGREFRRKPLISDEPGKVWKLTGPGSLHEALGGGR